MPGVGTPVVNPGDHPQRSVGRTVQRVVSRAPVYIAPTPQRSVGRSVAHVVSHAPVRIAPTPSRSVGRVVQHTAAPHSVGHAIAQTVKHPTARLAVALQQAKEAKIISAQDRTRIARNYINASTRSQTHLTKMMESLVSKRLSAQPVDTSFEPPNKAYYRWSPPIPGLPYGGLIPVDPPYGKTEPLDYNHPDLPSSPLRMPKPAPDSKGADPYPWETFNQPKWSPQGGFPRESLGAPDTGSPAPHIGWELGPLGTTPYRSKKDRPHATTMRPLKQYRSTAGSGYYV